MQGKACAIAVVVDAPDTEGTFVHGEVTVEDNDITSQVYEAERGIAVQNTRIATIKGNRVSGCKHAVYTKYVGKVYWE